MKALFVKKQININNSANGFAKGVLVSSSDSWALADKDNLPKQGDIFVYGNYEAEAIWTSVTHRTGSPALGERVIGLRPVEAVTRLPRRGHLGQSLLLLPQGVVRGVRRGLYKTFAKLAWAEINPQLALASFHVGLHEPLQVRVDTLYVRDSELRAHR